MKSKTRKAAGKASLDPLVRSSDYPERYPIECPNCGMVLHQSHAAIYGECLLCGAQVRPIRPPTANAEHQARVLPSPECSCSARNGGKNNG